jgi:hypothetical protein
LQHLERKETVLSKLYPLLKVAEAVAAAGQALCQRVLAVDAEDAVDVV